MKNLLDFIKGMWDLIYTIFIVGLIKFDNPLLSFLDYIALASTLISIITWKKNRRTRR